jgi:Tfp pilus assembly protein PilF
VARDQALLMGIVSYRQGKLQIALEYLTKALAALPGNPLPAKLLAATHMKLGEPEKAIGVLEPGMRRTPDAQMMAMLGSAYVRVGRHSEGQEWLHRAVEESPDRVDVRVELALSQLAARESDKALGELQSAVDLGQGIIAADVMLVLAHLKNLARLYHRSGDPHALEIARMAYDLDPQQVDIADNFGWILVNHGQAKEGLAVLEQVYAANPDRTEIGFRVAVALSRNGRDQEAANLLRRLLREDPGFEKAEEAKARLADLGD